jgi:hypothetical protein
LGQLSVKRGEGGKRGRIEEKGGVGRGVYGSIAFSDETCGELLVLIHFLRVRPDLLDGVQLGVLQDCQSNFEVMVICGNNKKEWYKNIVQPSG